MNKKVPHICLDRLIYLKTGGVSVLCWNSNFSMVFCPSSWGFFVLWHQCWIPLLQEYFVHRLLVFGILQVQIVWFIYLLPSDQHGLKSGIHCQLNGNWRWVSILPHMFNMNVYMGTCCNFIDHQQKVCNVDYILSKIVYWEKDKCCLLIVSFWF